jgi:3-phenylpropionate/cinnamic acid dioxygenase small subunit
VSGRSVNARDEIRELMFRYCEMIDAGDVDGLVELFAHAVLGGFEGDREWQGRDEIRAMYSGAGRRERTTGTRRTKHITTNVLIELDDDAGTATARSYWVLLTSQSPNTPIAISLAGSYHDRFERVDERWRFAERRYLVDLQGSDSAQLLTPERA